MAEEPINIVLEHLRRIDRKVDKIGDDVTELKTRMIALEGHIPTLRASITASTGSSAGWN